VFIVDTILDTARFNHWVWVPVPRVAYIPRVTLITSYCDVNMFDMGKASKSGAEVAAMFADLALSAGVTSYFESL
jgi:hypothetical protein